MKQTDNIVSLLYITTRLEHLAVNFYSTKYLRSCKSNKNHLLIFFCLTLVTRLSLKDDKVLKPQVIKSLQLVQYCQLFLQNQISYIVLN